MNHGMTTDRPPRDDARLRDARARAPRTRARARARVWDAIDDRPVVTRQGVPLVVGRANRRAWAHAARERRGSRPRARARERPAMGFIVSLRGARVETRRTRPAGCPCAWMRARGIIASASASASASVVDGLDGRRGWWFLSRAFRRGEQRRERTSPRTRASSVPIASGS